MDALVPSARSENAIGYFLLEQRLLDEALAHFQKAVALNPTFESPYMNVAEIEAANGNYGTAITLYQKAMKLAPDRGLIYIRMGQLYAMADHNLITARKVWQTGLKYTIDADARAQLQKLLT